MSNKRIASTHRQPADFHEEQSDAVWFERWKRNKGVLRRRHAIEKIKGGCVWARTDRNVISAPWPNIGSEQPVLP